MKNFKGFEHGINLGGWLSQCDHSRERYDSFIKEEDFAAISSWKLDHIRLPIDYELVEDKDCSFKEEGFAYIQKAIDWSRKYKLNMILDLHKTFGFSFDEGEHEKGFFENPSYQERFYSLWERLAEHCLPNIDILAFELLNEVTEKEYCDSWNRIAVECIKRIRKIAPSVKILVGGYYNNSIEAVKDIAMPYDENIVYNFHCYEPLIFTHQGAHWIPTMDTKFRLSIDEPYKALDGYSKKYLAQATVGFNGFDQDESLGIEYFDKCFAEAVKIAEERNVALYCGEYGVIENAQTQDTLKWYKIISEAFNKYKIGRAAWSYKEMNFGLVDKKLKDILPELTSLL